MSSLSLDFLNHATFGYNTIQKIRGQTTRSFLLTPEMYTLCLHEHKPLDKRFP